MELKLMEVLQEYFIALIMSTLKIGPKTTKNFGFDIIAY